METRNYLKWNPSKFYREGKDKMKIIVHVSLDDECKNKHCDFSITCSIYRVAGNGHLVDAGGGCNHEEIGKHFPELQKFFPLHLCAHEGTPMYPEANGIYFIEHDTKECAMRNLRCTEEEYETLSKFTKEKLYFKYLLFDLGIVERWKKEADEFIAFLEEKCGYKWVNPYTPEQERFRLVLTDEERATIEKQLSEGGFTPESLAERRQKEFEAEKAKYIEEIEAEYKKRTGSADAKRKTLRYILDQGISLKNVIYYDHSNEVHFNWKSYDDLITQEEFVDFINNLDYSIIPEFVTFHIDNVKPE